MGKKRFKKLEKIIGINLVGLDGTGKNRFNWRKVGRQMNWWDGTGKSRFMDL